MTATFMDFEQSCNEAGRLKSLGNIPLLVISRDPDRKVGNPTTQRIAAQRVWDHEQEKLKSLSPLSWRVIARNAGHAVHHDRLELVVAEETKLINYLRGGPAPPFGSTAVQ